MLRAMSAFKYDYPAMKLDFVRAPIKKSVRQVALDAGVPEGSVSAVQMQARKDHWEEARDEYQNRSQDRIMDALASEDAKRALRRSQVQSNAAELIDEAITSARKGLKETHYVREHDENGVEIWVERAKHPVSIPSIVALFDRLERVFGVSLLSSEASSGSGLDIDPKQLTAGGVDILVAFARSAAGNAPVPVPRRVGSSEDRDPETAGEAGSP
jgi:hypothetical protein